MFADATGLPDRREPMTDNALADMTFAQVTHVFTHARTPVNAYIVNIVMHPTMPLRI